MLAVERGCAAITSAVRRQNVPESLVRVLSFGGKGKGTSIDYLKEGVTILDQTENDFTEVMQKERPDVNCGYII